MQVAPARLPHRAPNRLRIPGTASVAHLYQNLAAADLVLSAADLAVLDGIGAGRRLITALPFLTPRR